MDAQGYILYALLLFYVAMSLVFFLSLPPGPRMRTLYGLLSLGYGLAILAWPYSPPPWLTVVAALLVTAGYGLWSGTLYRQPVAHLAPAYGITMLAWPEPQGELATVAAVGITLLGFLLIHRAPAPAAPHDAHH